MDLKYKRGLNERKRIRFVKRKCLYIKFERREWLRGERFERKRKKNASHINFIRFVYISKIIKRLYKQVVDKYWRLNNDSDDLDWGSKLSVFLRRFVYSISKNIKRMYK
jgi:hypothetical protein